MTRDDGIQEQSRATTSLSALTRRLIAWARRLLRDDGYRPEKHYMRGSGPKSRLKRTQASLDGADGVT